MELSVKAHIAGIQQQIDQLTAQLNDGPDALAALEYQSHIRSLNLALAHYQLALQIEQEVRTAQSRKNTAGPLSGSDAKKQQP